MPQNKALSVATVLAVTCAAPTFGDNFVNENLSVRGKACLGAACIEDEPVFAAGTLKLKGSQTSILFQDTSAGIAPSNDWQLKVNGSTKNFIAFTDMDAGTDPFVIEAGAPSNALVIFEASGDIGMGTPFPRRELHIRSSLAPMILLEGDGSSGEPASNWELGQFPRFSLTNYFGISRLEPVNSGSGFTRVTPFYIDDNAKDVSLIVGEDGNIGIGTLFPSENLHIRGFQEAEFRLELISFPGMEPRWDIGIRDDEFYIQDETGDGNEPVRPKPFRIRPGAPQNALFVDANGEVGMGISNPRGALHVRRNQPTNVPHLVLENRLQDGRTEIWFEDRDTPTDDDALRLQLRGDVFNVTFNGTGAPELQVRKDGDVRILRGDLRIASGGVVVNGSTLNVPDYVFAEGYELMPLSDVAVFIDENSHLPHIPSAGEIAQNGLDMTAMQLAMLKSHEELVLHTLAQEARIADQQQTLDAVLAELDAMRTRLDAVGLD